MNRFRVQVPNQRWFEENIGCENACPVNTRAPQYISAIREENYNLAFELNRGDNLSPLFWAVSVSTRAKRNAEEASCSTFPFASAH